MYIQKIVAPLLVTMLLCGSIVFLPRQVFAQLHCGCGNCAMASTGWCTCSIPPYWCSADDDAFLFRSSTDIHPAEAVSDVAGLISISTESDLTKTVKSLASGAKCLHRKVTLNLLRNVSDTLTFVPVHFDEKI